MTMSGKTLTPEERNTLIAQLSGTTDDQDWWRNAVIYQIFPRSFADGNGDGNGDFKGISAHLAHLAGLGVDALWVSPFYTSPQADGGYDVADYRNVDAMYGALHDFDDMLVKAHRLGLKVIIDIVANHTSDQHPWFQEALAAAPGSAARDRYLFRDGRGENGELPPNNWPSDFEGPAWTRVADGQWYLHLFSEHQPDLNWDNADVLREFESILRFWLDRGVDGIRVDAAQCLIKEEGLPDLTESTRDTVDDPRFDCDRVHEIYRAWRSVVNEYDNRVMIGETPWIKDFSRSARYMRADELHTLFNFNYQFMSWSAKSARQVVQASLEQYVGAGSVSTWVMASHDRPYPVSKLGLTDLATTLVGIGPHNEQPNLELGLRRARAIVMLTLGLPGSACLYQGEELGLFDNTQLEAKYRQDPRFFTSPDPKYIVGRDGFRTPLPWNSSQTTFGFSTEGKSWLPQPDSYRDLCVDVQQFEEDSTLSLYRMLIALRRQFALGDGVLEYLESDRDDVLMVRNGRVTIMINFGYMPIAVPQGDMLLCSDPTVSGDDAELPGNAAMWYTTD